MEIYKINTIIQRIEDMLKRLITVNIIQCKSESEFPDSWHYQLNDLSRDSEELKEYLLLSKDVEAIERLSKIDLHELGNLVFNGFYKKSAQQVQDIVLNLATIKNIEISKKVLNNNLQGNSLSKIFVYLKKNKYLDENQNAIEWLAAFGLKPVTANNNKIIWTGSANSLYNVIWHICKTVSEKDVMTYFLLTDNRKFNKGNINEYKRSKLYKDIQKEIKYK